MDYEKKYNKLVNAIKVLQETNPSDEGIQNWVNDNVPELKESEDEKVRKEIIAILQYKYEKFSKDPKYCNVPQWIAWLEKQGEKDKDVRYKYLDELLYTDDIYQMAMNDAMVNEAKEKAAKALSKFGIGKLLGFENQCEQKPAEWSEEDEGFRNLLIAIMKFEHPEGVFEANGITPFCGTVSVHRVIDWLESLKDRYTWKPTSAQMKALDSAIDEFDGYPEFDSLVSLKKDLEKLKGE